MVSFYNPTLPLLLQSFNLLVMMPLMKLVDQLSLSDKRVVYYFHESLNDILESGYEQEVNVLINFSKVSVRIEIRKLG